MPAASFIASPPAPSVNLVSAGLRDPTGSTIISARTFHQVQRQLFVPPPPPPPPTSAPTRALPMFVPHQIKRSVVPPPPPPPASSSPNFRTVAPPSNTPMAGPSYPPFEPRFPRLGPRGPSPAAPPKVISAPPKVISAPPKIVYSAAPVLNKKPEEPKKDDDASPPAATSSPASSSASAAAAKSATPPVASPQQSQQQAQPGPSGSLSVTTTTTTTTTTKKDKKPKKDRRLLRQAGGETWEDPTLGDWDPDDFRIFVGDIGNEVSDEHLTRAFGKYPSFQKAKVVRDKRTNKSRGFGFVSFKDPQDFIRAMRELNGKYIGNRPMKLRKSNWKDRNMDVVRKKEKEKKKLGLR